MKEIKITGKLGNIYSFRGDYDLKKGDTVYTHPKEWVELTPEDIAKLWANSGNIVGYGGLTFENIRAVEAACKEKNYDDRN